MIRTCLFVACVAGLIGAAGCGATTTAPAPRRRVPDVDAGPPPTVDMDAGAPTATPAYLAAKAKAKTFAQTFSWSTSPTIEQAPKETGVYGGIGQEPFAIPNVEVWVKKGEFSVRAATGGVDRCLGPEIVVRGELETKTFTSPLDAGRGYFQAPRGGAETDAVRFVETTSYESKTAYAVAIDKIDRDADGVPITVSGRFVVVVEPRSPFKNLWAAGKFDNAKVTAFSR